MTDYNFYMKKCIELARQAEGHTSPNPLVGCVVLDKNGIEIATGYHKEYGALHAEADALGKLGDEAIGGTLFVNLEPCNHHGKTPPCADLIIKKGIKKLVIGMKDPNPVAQGGIEKCKKAGIEVVEGVLFDEVSSLNAAFIKNVSEQKLFVALKTATTIDGKIATKSGSSKWITSEKSRNEVQKIRNRYDAILTTAQTVIADNPSMTCRAGRNPVKIILDREMKTDFDSKIYTSTGEEIYIVADESLPVSAFSCVSGHIGIIRCPVVDSKLDLVFLFAKLFELKIMSVLIEAGGKLNGDALSRGLVDKIYHFVAPKVIADNSALSAFDGQNVLDINDSINLQMEKITPFSPDYMVVYRKV